MSALANLRGRVVFDASRLVRRAGNAAPTGVDRVVLAYAKWALQWPGGCVGVVDSRWGWGVLTHRQLHEFVQTTEQWWSRAHETGERGRPAPMAVRPIFGRDVRREARGGALYVNVGHTGLHDGRAAILAERLGVPSVVFVHDAIPCTHPEFARPGEAARHRRRLEAAARSALVIFNSASTAESVETLWRAWRVPAPPQTLVLPLGVEERFRSARWCGGAERPYFVVVGTIEPRKNLAMLLMVWRRLAEMLRDRTPILHLIGRRGWENESVIDLLERCAPIQPYVREHASAGDDEVAALLARCRALLAPSFVEGFNLPLAEALCMDVPVIASDIAAHRDLARGRATLLDPLAGDAWLREIESMALGRAPSRPGSDRSAPGWERLSWANHFAGLGAQSAASVTAPEDAACAIP